MIFNKKKKIEKEQLINDLREYISTVINTYTTTQNDTGFWREKYRESQATVEALRTELKELKEGKYVITPSLDGTSVFNVKNNLTQALLFKGSSKECEAYIRHINSKPKYVK